MDRRNSRSYRFITVCAILVLAATLLVAGLAVPPAQAQSVSLTADEARMLNLLNQARSDAGLAPLYAEAQLTGMARDLSDEMAQYGFFSHDSPYSGNFEQRIDLHGITGWQHAAENIALGHNVDTAFQNLMTSTAHRDNMLDPRFNCVGIGVAQSADGLLVTLDFMDFATIPPTADFASIPGGSSFDTYILMSNPGVTTAHVTVALQKEDGAQQQLQFDIRGHSRYTLPLTPEQQGSFSFSSTVSSSVPIVAERAMYFSYSGRDGGHDSMGAPNTSRQWYFAEGYTGGDFDTYLLVQNPGSGPAKVSLRFMREDGTTVPLSLNVEADSRATIHADEVPGLENAAFSTQVTSDVPVVAERAMYFWYAGHDGGHDSLGAESLSTAWFFAEGYTGGEFDTYFLLQNPDNDAAGVTLNFMREDGQIVPLTVQVPGLSRCTVHADEIPGLENAAFSTQVDSNRGIVAERAMYFSYAGHDGGHDSVGAPGLSPSWYFAEGYTGSEFDTYILLQNPQDEIAGVDLSFMLEDGSEVPLHVDIPAYTRYTVHVDEVPGLANAAFSTRISAKLAIVAERAMYFNYMGRTDGHDSMGAMSLSPYWYFAEGCVR